MKTVIKAIAAVATVLVMTVGHAAAAPGPVIDGSNMGWNAPNQNG